MANIIVVFHSGYGHTQRMAESVSARAGAMAQTPSDASADEMLPGDLETARRFGERVALVAQRWAR